MRIVKLDAKEQKNLKKIHNRIESEKLNSINTAWDSTIQYLMDTNILLKILNENSKILENLVKHAHGKKIKFILLSAITIQLHNVIKHGSHEGHKLYAKDRKTLVKKLQEIGHIEDKRTNDMSPESIWALKFLEEKKYVNKNTGEPLEKRDCLLLKCYLDNSNYTLVTHDGLLKYAAVNEGNMCNRSQMIFDPVA